MPTSDGVPAKADLAAQLDALGIAVAKVDALAAVAVESFDNSAWRNASTLQIERMALVLGTAAEAAAAAVAAVDRFRTLVADLQPAEAGDDWGAMKPLA